jgi:hypothetical protein
MEMQLLQLAAVVLWICHLDSFGKTNGAGISAFS